MYTSSIVNWISNDDITKINSFLIFFLYYILLKYFWWMLYYKLWRNPWQGVQIEVLKKSTRMRQEDVCMVQRSHAFTIIVGTIIFEVNKISQISQTKVCNLVPVNYMSITTSFKMLCWINLWEVSVFVQYQFENKNVIQIRFKR